MNKNEKRMSALRSLIDAGYTPAEAMFRLEKQDGHKAKLPEIVPSGVSSGATKSTIKTGKYYDILSEHFRTKVKNKWTASKYISIDLNLNKTHVQYDLASMADRKLIERRKLTVHGAYEFRELQTKEPTGE